MEIRVLHARFGKDEKGMTEVMHFSFSNCTPVNDSKGTSGICKLETNIINNK